ncbi:MAG: cytosol nonspecific dipeptidase, partial [Candidatus Hermodarchaeota archaeon]
FESKLLKITKETYDEFYNKEVIITAVHGCLEPGVLKTNFPELDMITIGPTIEALHSPDERLDVESVETFWNILVHLLNKIK